MGLGRFILAGLIGALVALWTWVMPGDPAIRSISAGEPVIEASLLDNGFHTDLALPRAALEARDGPLAVAVKALPPGGWILIGWGDAKFYVDQSPISDRLLDGARAFFRPGNASVVMLDPTQGDPRQMFAEDGRRDFQLSQAAFEAMAARIEASLDLSSGPPRIAAARPGDDARFFASREHFNIGHLCNHWTAGVLNAAGMTIRPFRSILSSEVVATVDRAKLDTTATKD
ncbi:DUF2459 domain-containing protein [Brevundimonas sp. M20]|uniref:DUF2459 domain-containing protein n=1 Tax=Brevundimonas sp. M20 TaxID=2591463 RepID=UPI0011475953|nr:DUF2459 domain-containing protein [Brevundimonas sp. M20]QDH74658.1 DUF2459 domain-containing protein [Brevundimonas sp. M20]